MKKPMKSVERSFFSQEQHTFPYRDVLKEKELKKEKHNSKNGAKRNKRRAVKEHKKSLSTKVKIKLPEETYYC